MHSSLAIYTVFGLSAFAAASPLLQARQGTNGQSCTDGRTTGECIGGLCMVLFGEAPGELFTATFQCKSAGQDQVEADQREQAERDREAAAENDGNSCTDGRTTGECIAGKCQVLFGEAPGELFTATFQCQGAEQRARGRGSRAV